MDLPALKPDWHGESSTGIPVEGRAQLGLRKRGVGDISCRIKRLGVDWGRISPNVFREVFGQSFGLLGFGANFAVGL